MDKSAAQAKWSEAIKDALKRDKEYLEQAKEAQQIYRMQRGKRPEFNALVTTAEILLPALYSEVPQPDVQRRSFAYNPEKTTEARIAEYTLRYLLDQNNPNIPTFHQIMRQSTLESYVAGRSTIRMVFSADVQEGQVTNEIQEFKLFTHDRFLHSEAQFWPDVTWFAFIHYMTKEECAEQGLELPEQAYNCNSLEIEKDKEVKQEGRKGIYARVYEIWDKVKREVVYFNEYAEDTLKVLPDPYQLEGFFPNMQPLVFCQTGRLDVYIPPYEYYRSRVRELNKVTERLDKVVEAMRVRGAYNGNNPDMEKVAKLGDNEFFPVTSAVDLANGGLEKHIWVWPIEKLAAVHQNLLNHRSTVKQDLDEITGVSDVMRGSNKASESAEAVKMKGQWGNVRMTVRQSDIANYIQSVYRLMLELAVTSFTSAALKNMTQLDLELEVFDQVKQILSDDRLRSYQINIQTSSTVSSEVSNARQDMAMFMNSFQQVTSGIAQLLERQAIAPDGATKILGAVVKNFRFGRELEEVFVGLNTNPPPKEPNPEEQRAQVQQQMETQKAEMEVGKLQLNMEIEKLRMQADADKLQLEAELRQREHSMRMELLEKQHEVELQRLQSAQQTALLQAELKSASLHESTEAKRETEGDD